MRIEHDLRDGNKRILAHFDSYFEYVKYSATAVTKYRTPPRIEPALTPRPDMLAKIERYKHELRVEPTPRDIAYEWRIGEGTVDIPTFLSGQPEYFLSAQKHPGKTLRLVFSPEAHVTSNPDGLFLRGAAVMEIVRLLEAKGHLVEIFLGWDNTVYASPVAVHYESRIAFKRSTDYISEAAMIFPMCDSSFLGSYEFNLIGHFLHTSSVGHNSGITMPGDIVIDGSYTSMAPFDSVETTRAWIREQFKRLSGAE